MQGQANGILEKGHTFNEVVAKLAENHPDIENPRIFARNAIRETTGGEYMMTISLNIASGHSEPDSSAARYTRNSKNEVGGTDGYRGRAYRDGRKLWMHLIRTTRRLSF